MEETAQLPVRVSPTGLKLDRKEVVPGVFGRQVLSPAVREEADAVPSDGIEALRLQQCLEVLNRVPSRVQAEPVDLAVSIESSQGGLPVSRQGRARGQGPGVLGYDRDDLRRKALSALRRLQRLPALVRGFFHDPDLRYILE